MVGDWALSREGGGEEIQAGPSVNLVRIPAAETGGRASVIEMRLDPGWEGPPPHRHSEIDHVWVVLDGNIRLSLEGNEVEASRGDVLWVPRGQVHSFATLSEPATLLQVDTPRGLDSYFRDLAAAFPRGTRPDPEMVREIMARHDTTASS